MVRDLAVALACQRCVSITAHDSTSQVLETLSTLDSEVIELTLDVRGRNAGIREVPAPNVVLDLPVVCATTDAQRCDQLFPIDAPAVVEYLPSIDESWYTAKDCTVQADKQQQPISSSASADTSIGARYASIGTRRPQRQGGRHRRLRLRQLQPRTLADVVCCPSLCVLTASSHRFNSAAVLEARLAGSERIDADSCACCTRGSTRHAGCRQCCGARSSDPRIKRCCATRADKRPRGARREARGGTYSRGRTRERGSCLRF